MKNSNRFFQITTALVVGCILSIQSVPYAQSDCSSLCTSTTDYCQLIPTYGIFLCVSTQVPSGASCAADTCHDSVCHYIHLRNVTACTATRINKIEITVTKHSTSSQFVICNPYTQWGQTPWTSQWTINSGGITAGACNNWNADTQRTITFTPPGGTNPDYTLTDLNHWMVTICGGASYSVKIFYDNGMTTCTFNPTVTNNQCPPTCP